MHSAEKEFLNCKGNKRKRRESRQVFIEKRKRFDTQLRREERQFTQNLRKNIQTLYTKHPKDFWNEIYKIGPGKQNRVIDSVLLDDGSISNDSCVILSKWIEDCSRLFSKEANNDSDEFVQFIKQINAQWEENDLDPTTNLNDKITIDEIKNALRKLKNGKATGSDNIPNEILKQESLVTVLCELFNVCLTYNVIPDVWCNSIIHPIM